MDTTPAPAAYHEAPVLAAQVTAGTLPALSQRLPSEPLVKETVEKIGEYGGTIRTVATTSGPYNDMQGGLEGGNLYQVAADGFTTIPNLAKGYEVSADNKTFTIFMRKGAKWSDGQSFTSEDIRFMYEDMHFNTDIRTWNFITQIKSVQVVDDYTVRLTAPEGLGSTLFDMGGWPSGRVNGYMPSHYLKKWHAKYNPDAQKVAASEGYVTWYDCLNSHFWWDPQRDLAFPSMRPWVLAKSENTEKLYDRNPYYWAVDKEGNQLPYLDSIAVKVVNASEYSGEVAKGSADIAYMDTTIFDLEQYRTGLAKKGYRFELWPDNKTSELTLDINLFHPDETYRRIMQDVRFRQALSYAIDRQAINTEFFMGYGVPSQLTVLPSASYYREEWGSLYAAHDTKQAGQLLDSVGLSKRDAAGMRVLDNGNAFVITLEYTEEGLTPPLQMIVDGWRAMGLEVSLRLMEGQQFDEAGKNRAFMIIVRSNPDCDERNLFRRDYLWDSWGTRPWWAWDAAKKKATKEELAAGKPIPDYYRRLVTSKDATLEGERPPDYYIDFMETRDKWFASRIGTPEYRELGAKVFDVYFKRVFTIGTVGRIPKPLVVSERLANVPQPGAIVGMALDHPVMMRFADQFAFTK